MAKIALKNLLLQKGLASGSKEALALILRGLVLVDGQRIDKAGTLVNPDCEIRVKPFASRYVSRGGEKLEAVLSHPGIGVEGKVCLDLGASTGGFTDCLLQHGAIRVYAFDVGRGLMEWNLRQDPRVVLRENFNVRTIQPSDVGESPEFVTIDLSFISLRTILPNLRAFGPLRIAALVKPQFEAERWEVEPGGLILDSDLRRMIVDRVRDFAVEQGFTLAAEIPSPIAGAKGNQEVFLLLQWQG